jgi:hypothetical protein
VLLPLIYIKCNTLGLSRGKFLALANAPMLVHNRFNTIYSHVYVDIVNVGFKVERSFLVDCWGVKIWSS